MTTKREFLLSIMEAAQTLMTTELHPEQFREIRDIDEKIWSIIEYASPFLSWNPEEQLDKTIEDT